MSDLLGNFIAKKKAQSPFLEVGDGEKVVIKHHYRLVCNCCCTGLVYWWCCMLNKIFFGFMLILPSIPIIALIDYHLFRRWTVCDNCHSANFEVLK